MPATVAVSKIDFKRGEDGAGRLILQFDGQGASPDLRTQGSTVLVDVGNARLPAELQRPLNVTDFATPVQRIDAKPSGGGSQLVLSTTGPFGVAGLPDRQRVRGRDQPAQGRAGDGRTVRRQRHPGGRRRGGRTWLAAAVR